MNLICKLFGHKSREKCYSGGEYMRVSIYTTDGIGRVHATLSAQCPRCNAEYRAGMIHLPKTEATVNADAQPAPTKDWTEDAGHENGKYECRCCECGSRFTGHKRRVVCKVCDSCLAPETDK